MKREGTIGAAALLAVLAVVGISVQTGLKPAESSIVGDETVKRPKTSTPKSKAHEGKPGCGSLTDQLKDFLDIGKLNLPGECYDKGEAPSNEVIPDLAQKTSQLKFVIALVPDPVHSHLSLLFDQFAVAIQEGAQDERYDFDSSWLPWDDEESSYPLLLDEKVSKQEKQSKENQPGLILFRKALNCPPEPEKKSDCREELSKSYREGLMVFVVGEEATSGIHHGQFRNALEWIAALRTGPTTSGKSVAILGPTFSGSIPSLAQALSDPDVKKQFDFRDDRRLAIYSGSVSSQPVAQNFQDTFAQVVFHSFVQNDDEILRRFSEYICHEQGSSAGRVAILSEDETAYGGRGVFEKKNPCGPEPLNLYYPRDISALRGAYQTKLLFDAGSYSQAAETQRRSLPTDLADPAGRVHDSIRSYAGNQTPLAQEAILMEIVAELRDHQIDYVLLRGSNTLDQLFLTNFLRRSYPDGRIVIFASDLMFIREHGTTGLGGVMALSTYPLFPLEHEWTEHQVTPTANRVFGGDAVEGTYIAFRLLLNDTNLNVGKADVTRCRVQENQETTVFLPSVSCSLTPVWGYSPIPDYSVPFWMLRDQCGEMTIGNDGRPCAYLGPATWLSVIGVNRFWPTASLTKETPAAPSPDSRIAGRAHEREKNPSGRREMPLEMKIFFLILAGLSLFHAWCCWSGSYTAKPAFRAHFASQGEWRHTLLVLSGSCCVAFVAIVAGLGSGVFVVPNPGLSYPWFALCFVVFVLLVALAAILMNGYTVRQLARDGRKVVRDSANWLAKMSDKRFIRWNFKISGLFIAVVMIFFVFIVYPLEHELLLENRELTYWRAMHLASGMSPIVPVFSMLIGLYLSFWFTLHGLALFGPDRPRLPHTKRLVLKYFKGDKEYEKVFLRMFSQQDAAKSIEQAAIPLNKNTFLIGLGLAVLFLALGCAIAGGVPVRSLGAWTYSFIFIAGLNICCTLLIVSAWRLTQSWVALKRLLTFLDRLVLRRTLAGLHGFSWESVWRMSGNVLEVRYKIISRQMECMNHTISALKQFLSKASGVEDTQGAQISLKALQAMQDAGTNFADWYSSNYRNTRAGNLKNFRKFQKSVAATSGTLLTQLLVPAWRVEEDSLIVEPARSVDEKEGTSTEPPQAAKKYIRSAEELVSLTYLAFVQNVLGRLRTIALTIVVLFLACTLAISTYPFDPRQGLSAILIVLFVIAGVVIVKVYAEMHRDSTLSHVTNTKPGELGTEFWFKIVGFGFAPLIGLLTRIFPSIADFIFSWLQPGISSLK